MQFFVKLHGTYIFLVQVKIKGQKLAGKIYP